jgi:hypothetical protein
VPANEEGEVVSRIDSKQTMAERQPNGAALASLVDGPFAANMMMGQMASQITQEIMDFAGRRMRAQMDFVSTLPMGDVKGMMEAQFRFFEQASRDYAEEIGHVADVVRKAAETQTPAKG